MKQFQKTPWIGCTILAGLALACSGEPDLVELEPATTSDVSPEPSGAPEPFDMEALLSAEVTSEEAAVLEDFYARTSLGRPTSTTGRVLRWDDAIMTVDDVLRLVPYMDEQALAEKGYAQTNAANPIPGNPNAISFFRPEIFFYYVIVENNVPSSVTSSLTTALSGWAGLAVDCLGTGSFQVISRSAYNALTQNQKDVAYEIDFKHIPKTTAGWPCGNDPGCAAFPSFQSVKVGASFVSRMGVGKTIHVDSTTFPSGTTALTRFLRHEVGHALGFNHQVNGTSTSGHYIPGTLLCGNNCFANDMYPSVMLQGSGGGEFQPDDTKSLRTLYANEPNRDNDDCAYVDNFRTLAKLP